MIIEIGHFSTVIALVLAVFGIVSSGLALRTRDADWVRAGRMALTLIFVLLSVGMAALIYSFLARDFSVHYVATNSNSQLPLFYTIAAVWGGHEGSLLLWVFILSTFSTIAVWLHWRTQPAIMPYLIGMECLVILGFLLLILFLSSPFDRLIPAPAGRQGLEPLAPGPGHGHAPADAVHGLRGVFDSFFLCHGGIAFRPAGRGMDQGHPTVDDLRVGVPDHGHTPRRPTGPIMNWAGAVTGGGIRWKMPRLCRGWSGPRSCIP